MTTSSENLLNKAELSLASYAIFPEIKSPRNTIDFREELIEAGMTDEQFNSFTLRYPRIVYSIPNTSTGFSATVFKSSESSGGQLTVAFRGTELENPVDLYQADLEEIVKHGAAYHQIVDMYNWWKSATTTKDNYVQQYAINNIFGWGIAVVVAICHLRAATLSNSRS